MSKGGSTSSSVTVPDYIENAARRNLNKAEGISQIGYTPYYGPDVAAVTPMQQASFQNTANVADAFGMGTPSSGFDIMGGMGEPTQYANGVRGYSSAPIYEQSLDELAARRPAQKAYMDSFFIDPYTGAPGANVQSPNAMYPTYDETQAAAIQSMQDSRRDYRGDRNKQRMLDMMNREVDPTLAMAAGYTLPIESQPGNYDLFSGRGTDGQGKYGLLGDIGGAIGDATGFTSYNTPDVIQGRVDAEAARMAAENAARTAPAAKKKKSTSSALKKEMAKQADSRAQIDNERDSYY